MKQAADSLRPTLKACAVAVSLAVGVSAAIAQEEHSNAQQQRAKSSADEDTQVATRSTQSNEREGADEQDRSSCSQSAAPNRDQMKEAWAKMRGEVIDANELLSADVSNGFNPAGQITDLVLTPDHRQVQYILYETPYPYSFYGAEDGFARYDGVDFQQGAVFDTTLVLEPEDSTGAPEELELTRAQARARLVSRIIGSPLQFSGDESRDIEDILIDKDTGAVTHYVVQTDKDSVFRAERRTVPASRVMIQDDGQISAAPNLGELDDLQTYAPELL